MAVHDMKSLAEHAHHAIRCVTYGRNSVVSASLECFTCNEILVSYDADGQTEYCCHCGSGIVPGGPPACSECRRYGHSSSKAECTECLDEAWQEHEDLVLAKGQHLSLDCIGSIFPHDLVYLYEQLLAVEEGYA